MVAVFALSAAPQSASAKVHRAFYAVDQDFYMQFAYDDVSGVFAIRLMDWDGECYGEWYVWPLYVIYLAAHNWIGCVQFLLADMSYIKNCQRLATVATKVYKDNFKMNN